jgi:thioredoxin-like negative regulator of GroEL/tetratricopeptide (TPR) repeat protein
LATTLCCCLLIAACRPEKVEAPTAAQAPETDAGTGWLGNDSAQGAGPTRAEDPTKLRKRPKGADVGSRDAAISAVATGNPEGAARFLGPHLEKKPDDVDARLALARALVMRGRYEDAGKVLEPKRKPGSDARVMRGRAALSRLRGEYAAAEQTLRGALKAAPDDVGVRGQLLDLLADTGRRETTEARQLRDKLYDAWDEGKIKTPDHMLAVARATLSRRSRGGFEDAEMVLGEAEQLDPPGNGARVTDVIVLTHGHLFLKNYRPDEAAVSFAQILERDAWHPDALAGMAEVAMRSLRLANAARMASEALQTNPEHPDAHAILARVALVEGRREEARKHVEEHVLKVNPVHDQGLAVLAGLAIVEHDQKAYAKWRDRALAHNAKNESFFTTLADDLGFLHLYPEIAVVTRDALKRMPEDQFVLGVHGLNLMRLRGREMEGLEAIRKAYKKDRWNERTANTLDFYEEKITPADSPAYVDHESKKFSLRLPAHDDELLVEEMLAAANRARKALDDRYGLKLGKLRLEIYETPPEFSVRTVGVPSLGAVGVCFGHVITTLGPYKGIHNFHQVVWHELAHVYAIELSKGRVPRWFTEGLSEWESELADPSWARESADLLLEAKAAGRLRTLSELELGFLRAENGLMMEAAYSKAAYAMRYLGQTYGLPKIKAILKGYATGATTDALFKKHLGKGMATVEKEFEAWFDKELTRRSSGWRPDRTNDQKRNALYGQAMEQARDGKLEEASRLLEELIQNGGDGHFTRMLLARLLLERKETKAAKQHLAKARAFNLESIEGLMLLVEVARRQNDVEAEKKHLQDAMQIDAMSFDPAARLLMLSLATQDQKRFDYALDRAIAIAPLHPIALSGLSYRLSKKKGQRARSRALVNRAAEQLRKSQGGPPDGFVVTAIASDRLGDGAVAKEMADKAKADKALPEVARKRLDEM